MGGGIAGLRTLLAAGAIPADGHTAKTADDADERSARGARVAFGRPLFVPAGAAYHRVVLSLFCHP